jgi:2-aminoethylphosphonate-pyruvate transaminase
MLRTAVILAAGMGRRLAERGRDVPKGFLQLGDEPIIEESIARLRRAGIERIVIVTGHLREYYEALAGRYSCLVQTLHNDLYRDSGSMYSLYLARDVVQEPFLLLESDLIYEQRALTTLCASPSDNALLLSGFTGAGDEVFVEAHDGNLVRMSKRREDLGPRIAGELVGISRLSVGLFDTMLRLAAERFATTLHMDYETDCMVAAASQVPIRCELVPDLLWSEIDDETHYQRARLHIYPAVLERGTSRGAFDPR